MSSMPEQYIELLKSLIRTPSLSGQEDGTAALLEKFFTDRQWVVHRVHNNIWTAGKNELDGRPIVLLNAHHDTVPPNAGYTRDPHSPEELDGRIFGLGSNDDGGALISLIAAFEHLESHDLPFQLVMLASAEEENSGPKGVTEALKNIPTPAFGLVGEPTGMHFAAAEKGLMVVDVTVTGEAGHAARNLGRNAIYESTAFINWIATQPLELQDGLLGRTRLSVTQINAGQRHNMIPDQCKMVLDIRSTGAYNNETILQILKDRWPEIQLEARSTRLQPSTLAEDHPAYRTARELGLEIFGSPTMSDQALMSFPTAKMGPGLSERSHTADEFILREELDAGISGYIQYITTLAKNWQS